VSPRKFIFFPPLFLFLFFQQEKRRERRFFPFSSFFRQTCRPPSRRIRREAELAPEPDSTFLFLFVQPADQGRSGSPSLSFPLFPFCECGRLFAGKPARKSGTRLEWCSFFFFSSPFPPRRDRCDIERASLLFFFLSDALRVVGRACDPFKFYFAPSPILPGENGTSHLLSSLSLFVISFRWCFFLPPPAEGENDLRPRFFWLPVSGKSNYP